MYLNSVQHYGTARNNWDNANRARILFSFYPPVIGSVSATLGPNLADSVLSSAFRYSDVEVGVILSADI